jgi:hypothetical protein
MSLDFQQVHQQVRQLGEVALQSSQAIADQRQLAHQLLKQFASQSDVLRRKVQRVVEAYEPSLRCAIPCDPQVRPPEALDASFGLPPLPLQATIMAADGSQIPIDRHAPVLYCLVNVGAIHMSLGAAQPPQLRVQSDLKYDTDILTEYGLLSDGALALMRDKAERAILAEMVESAVRPVFAFTDGPVELWGAKDGPGGEADFTRHLNEYLEALRSLAGMGATVAGYVDKPYANLVVRLLEIGDAEESELRDIRGHRPLRRVNDVDLFRALLPPGARSAVFGMQSQAGAKYEGELALHFFYLNVGRDNHPWLARVEIPAWVAADPEKLDSLQAVLVDQCRMMGSRPYPYLLHRAHETAVVSFEEREQVTQMIAVELRRRGVEVGEQSYKQSGKELDGRTGYK